MVEAPPRPSPGPCREPRLRSSSARKTETGRTHLERRKEAEERILSAALHIVAERGLAALTLQEAGEAAGYSRALPAHYYKTREHMLAAVVTHVVIGYRERQAAGGYGGLEGVAALFADVRHHVCEALQTPAGMKAFYEVLEEAARQPALGPTVARLNTETLEAAVGHLRAAMAAGEVRADLDPRLEAVLFLSLLRGLVSRWLKHPDEFDLAAAADAMIAGLERNWAPPR